MDRIDEATRRELIDKSKNAKPTKAYGTNRYGRRNVQRIYNSLSSFNKIDMNALYHADLLSFIIPIHGETDNYDVEVLFEGVCEDIKKEIKRNNNKIEYKCVYRALINAINRQDIYVACTCPDWHYRFAYHSTKDGYNGGRPELRPAKITNPNNDLGIGCKHVMAALENLDWALKLASTIFNYIIYMEDNYKGKFQTIMFPKLFDISWEDYEKTQEVEISADRDVANAMDDEEGEAEVDAANVYGSSRYTPKRSDVEYAHDEREEPEEEEEQ